MLIIVEKYLTIFFIYSILGWIVEIINGLIQTKKIVNRGFLIGPYCPIYGIGVCLLTALLSKYANDIPILFFMSMLICGTLEYFTSYIMEKVFKARWWDYSKRKFNINGRICLETLIPFGIAGVVLVKYVNPFFLQILEFDALKFILIIISVIFIIDFVFSFKGILGFRKTTKQVEKEVKDNTEEISKHMKELATEKYEELKEMAIKKKFAFHEATTYTIIKLKQGASEKINDAKEDLQDVSRKINISYKKAKRSVQFTGKKLFNNLIESREKLRERFMKSESEKTANKLIRERVREKSWVTRRLLDAFPNMQIKLKNKTKNEKKNK